MTKWQRIRSILGSLVTILCGIIMAAAPELGRLLIIALLACTAVLAGIRRLVYYFSMTRFMVGGRTILYQGLILLDLGMFTLGCTDIPGPYIMIYLLICYLFYGLIDVLRSMEIRRRGLGSWRFKLLVGLGNIGLSLICLTQLGSSRIMVYIYSLGMIWSALGRIVDACRKSAVLYVQQA